MGLTLPVDDVKWTPDEQTGEMDTVPKQSQIQIVDIAQPHSGSISVLHSLIYSAALTMSAMAFHSSFDPIAVLQDESPK